jgi:hypothetical protein
MSFIKYKLSWRFTDDGRLQEAIFYLPEGENPDVSAWMGDVINLVELSASEYGYEYELEVIG